MQVKKKKKKIIFINMNHTRGCLHKTRKYAENWGGGGGGGGEGGGA